MSAQKTARAGACWPAEGDTTPHAKRARLGRLAWRFPVPVFGRDVWLLSLAVGVIGGGYLGMMQLLRVIYVLRLGLGPEAVGSMFATGALSFMAFSLPAGALGSRYGARRMMLIGALVNLLGMAMLPLTESAPRALQPSWPLLAQAVAAVGWSIVMVNQVPAIAAYTTISNRRNAYAMKEAFVGLGTFLGTLFAGLLPGVIGGLLGLSTDQPAPYRYALLACLATGLGGLVPLTLISEVRAGARPSASRARRPALLPLLLLVACAFLNHSAVASCRAFNYAYMDASLHLPTSAVGALSGVGMLVAVPGALSSVRLSRRRGSGLPMMVASLGLSASLLVMGLVQHWSAAGLGTMGTLALTAMWVPAYQVLQMDMASPEWRSVTAGAGTMAMSLGFGSMSLAGGHIVAAVGYRWVFLLGAALASLSAGVMWVILGRSERRAAGRRAAHHTERPAGRPSLGGKK